MKLSSYIFVVLIAGLTFGCQSKTNSIEASRDDKATATPILKPQAIIEETMQNIKNDLKKIKSQFPQLKDIEKLTIGKNSFSYKTGITEGESKTGTPFLENGCNIYLEIGYPATDEDRQPPLEDSYILPNGITVKVWFLVSAEKTKQGQLLVKEVTEILTTRLKEMKKELQKEFPNLNILERLSQRKDGKWTSFYENGKKKEEGQQKDGMKTGKWTYWYENGQKKAECVYINNLFDGELISWHANGQKAGISKYINGKEIGKSVCWYDDGCKQLEKTYKDDGKHAVEISWHKNGKKKSEGNYKDNFKDGNWIGWYDNEQKAWEGCYEKSQEVGKWISWHKNGNKEAEGIYRQGVKYGRWTYWYDNGKKKSEGKYEGELMYRYCETSNGRHVSMIRPSGQPLKYEKWIYWDEKGDKTKEETFDITGKLIETIEYKDGVAIK